MNEAEQYVEPYEDEISLRDLYLILRKGLPLILGATVVAGVLAFVVSSLLPAVYSAEATTLVSPSPVQIKSAQNLTFNPSNEISFEAYQTLAESRPVAEAALNAVPEADMQAEQFGGQLTMLIGPQRPDQVVPLSVSHSVRHGDPAMAAALADAWAKSTIEALQTSLLASLDPIRSATRQEIARLDEDVSATEARFERFERGDEGVTLEALLTGLNSRINLAESRRDTLNRDLAAAQAQLTLLLETLRASGEALDPTALASLLELAQARRSESTDETGNSVEADEAEADRPELGAALELQAAGLSADVTELLNRIGANDLAVDIAGFRAELMQLETQLEGYEQEAQDLRARIAELNIERTQLERELERSRQAYDDVALLEPIISYVTEITPTNARLLNSASVPSFPVGPRRSLNTALAAVIAGILATLFVFLREAVRAPPTGVPKKSNQAGSA